MGEEEKVIRILQSVVMTSFARRGKSVPADEFSVAFCGKAADENVARYLPHNNVVR